MILSSEATERLQITTQVVFVFRIEMSVRIEIVLSVGPSAPICIIRLISLDFRTLLLLCCSEPTTQLKRNQAASKKEKNKHYTLYLYYFTFSKSHSGCRFLQKLNYSIQWILSQHGLP